MTQEPYLVRNTPESQGVPSSAILSFIQEVEQNIHDMHSFMLLRHGTVIAEAWWSPYAPEIPHMLFSLSKSYTSTAIGFAVTEGLLSVDDQVISFFPDETPKEVSRNLAAMKVRHLLSMSTGHTEDTTGFFFRRRDGNWVKAFLARPVKKKPGTHFLYNTGATYMLSAILQKLTGQKLIDYLQTRLFDPLGIQGATWETCPRGINTGGFGLSVKTEDIARFGQLYLQKGVWQGKRLLPEAWIDEATSKQISNGSKPESDWEQGYGYQFWRCRHNIYRGDGAFGQYCIVMPEQDAVLAITSGLPDMQAPLDIAWNNLLPAMQSASLPENADAQAMLKNKVDSLSYSPPKVEDKSPLIANISGKRYLLEKNPLKIQWLSLEFAGGKCQFTMRDSRATHHLMLGNGEWLLSETDFPIPENNKVAASGTWTADDTFVITMRCYETPFVYTLSFKFDGGSMTMNFKGNVSFGPTETPEITGKMK